ncbi:MULTISPECIES: histidine phosphatase family protein [Bacillus]|uniref:Histidine phosphatase family protein n=1 Tax=Bacillus wiedmannii TaxID=1890302 RepID=A0A1A9PUF3_9BACI|nr:MULTISPECIES: histidine phosphatase family protein [Bacillus]OUB84738.1 histidine phosphatase family protein [Bacillus thuringiensis serovar sinensis]KAA0786440.1 histidine phosphatase family protein [Bacillus sp. BPN334]MBY7112022.1 histidine phosphatase family protein [Bacillus sp. 17RED48]MBY7121447.1 histidine phosphatase family protein [Bacillus sp. 16GRE42]MCR6848031.1 phosphoglycerate mutase family protein [Bacillus sp. IBL03825]
MKNRETDSNENVVTLYVTRHGKTILNTNHRAQGWADSPLVEKGVEVASNLGTGLKDVHFTNAYSSDSGRAIETANLVLKYSEQSKLKLEKRKKLRELNFGIFEGEKLENMWDVVGKAAGVASPEELMKFSIQEVINLIRAADPTKQAEDWELFSTRIKEEIDKISEEAAANGGGNVLVVVHGLLITTLIEMLDSSKTKLGVENASVTQVVYKDGTYTVESVGDMSYVAKGKESVEI